MNVFEFLQEALRQRGEKMESFLMILQLGIAGKKLTSLTEKLDDFMTSLISMTEIAGTQ